MGIVGRARARIGRFRDRRPAGDGPRDRSLTKEYWEEAAGGSVETAVDAICDGFDMKQFESLGEVHFDPSELGPDMVVLDLACGMGRTCKQVAGAVAEYHGVDFVPGMIDKARRHNEGVRNAAFLVNDGATLKEFADGTFDVVYSELAFQHMPKATQRSYASEAARVLKDGGKFFAQLPKVDFYPGAEYALDEDEARSLLAAFRKVDLGDHQAYWLARGVAGRKR